MAQPKKVMINHDLAKALMAAGMEHMDSGGLISGVTNLVTPTSGFSAALAPTQTSNYGGAISDAQSNAGAGYGNFQHIQRQQQGLADQLQQQTLGQGPNPAQAALNSNTGTNVANTAALLASQRGASANPGLLARQAAQQGAGIQQNAVGQEAVLQAQQQLSAEQQLQQQQALLASGNVAEQAANTGLLTSNISGQNGQNTEAIQNYGMAQGLNEKTAEANAAAQQKTAGGIFSGIGSSLASLFAEGGKVPDHLHEMGKIYHPEFMKGLMKGGKVPGKAAVKGNSYQNDNVPALLSPGEAVLPRSVTQSKNAPQKAAEFMKHLKGHSSQKEDPKDLQKAMKSKKSGSLKDRVARLEKICAGRAS